jgi:hypothetical protein
MIQGIFLQCLDDLMGKEDTFPLILEVKPISVVVFLGSPEVTICYFVACTVEREKWDTLSHCKLF